MWMFNAVKEIDFSYTDFMKESFLVHRESYGGITRQDLKDMDFKEYLEIVNYADYMQRENRNG